MSSETVTAGALAKMLYRILDSRFAAAEVERAHDLLDRYGSQKKLGVAVSAAGLDWAYVVELEPVCWLADGKGDPSRTLVMSNARIFRNHFAANLELSRARKYKPFRNAKVVRIEASIIGGSNG